MHLDHPFVFRNVVVRGGGWAWWFVVGFPLVCYCNLYYDFAVFPLTPELFVFDDGGESLYTIDESHSEVSCLRGLQGKRK